MKKEAQNEKQKVLNTNKLYSKNKSRTSKIMNDSKDSNEKPNPLIIHKFGQISDVEVQLCKGPPGRGRSPDPLPCRADTVKPKLKKNTIDRAQMNTHHNDEKWFGAVSNHLKEMNIQNQNMKTNSKSNFYKSLILTIMKKQILFLALFSLALIFAGLKSYGQDKNYVDGASAACAPVTPLPCVTEDALHPLPGKTYTYNVTVNPAVSTGAIHWFVYNATTNNNLITAGSIAATIAAAEPDGGTSQFLLDADNAKYNLATNTSGTIDISWQSFDGTANRILLVAYVKGEGGCSDNIEVFRIEPAFAFTLDIAGLMPNGTLPASGNAKECVTPVQSATYDGTNLTMDYGDNYVFFTVTAANFVHSWQPTFSIVANNTQSPVALTDISWAYPTEAVKTTGGTWNAATDAVLAQAASKAVGASGECIVVRVHIDHGNNENDASAARNVIIGVDGIMYNVPTTNYSNNNLKDLDPSAAAPCTNTVTDQAQYDLTPRPEITTTVTPAPGFEPKN